MGNLLNRKNCLKKLFLNIHCSNEYQMNISNMHQASRKKNQAITRAHRKT